MSSSSVKSYPNFMVGLNSSLPTSHQLIHHHHHHNSGNQENQELEEEEEDNSQFQPMIDFINKVKLRLIPTTPHHQIENQGLSLCHNVKDKLAHTSGDYLKFLKLLHDHASGDITGVELQMCFADLVHNCPILLHQLETFLKACERCADLSN